MAKNGLAIALGMLGIPNIDEALKEIETLISSGAIQQIITFGEQVGKLTDAVQTLTAQNAEILAILRSRDAEFTEVASGTNGYAGRRASNLDAGCIADNGRGRTLSTFGES